MSLTELTPPGDKTGPTTQDWIDLIGVYRCVVRARTGWRFTSTAWADDGTNPPVDHAGVERVAQELYALGPIDHNINAYRAAATDLLAAVA